MQTTRTHLDKVNLIQNKVAKEFPSFFSPMQAQEYFDMIMACSDELIREIAADLDPTMFILESSRQFKKLIARAFIRFKYNDKFAEACSKEFDRIHNSKELP